MDRIQSIDIFRGLTIFVMVFVNDLAGVDELPAWMYHMPADADAMTFVDVVFPAFLFIVGMSIPLALERRIAKGENSWQMIRHILIRSLGLIVLGVFMVNAAEMNAEATLIAKSWWNILLYLSAILIWNQYPRNNGSRKNLYKGLQLTGLVVLAILAFVYRKGEPEALTGMTHSWWGILGLIGWAYLMATLIYLVVKNNLGANIGMVSLFVIIAVGLNSPELKLPEILSWLKDQAGHVIHTAITLCGVVLMLLLRQNGSGNKTSPITRTVVLGIFCLLAGYFLRPLYGISKIYATPSWALYSIANCCLVFAIIYWLVEIKNIRRWANFLAPAGMNPLLTYILPFIFYAAVGFSFLPDILNTGALGLIRSVIFSLIILGLAGLLTRWGIRLRL